MNALDALVANGRRSESICCDGRTNKFQYLRANIRLPYAVRRTYKVFKHDETMYLASLESTSIPGSITKFRTKINVETKQEWLTQQQQTTNL